MYLITLSIVLHESKTNPKCKEIEASVNKLIYYPLVILYCYLFVFISNILEVFHRDLPKWCDQIAFFNLSLLGILSYICFGHSVFKLERREAHTMLRVET
jgi:hypothetical protein